MVVEDESLIRWTTCEALRDAGFTVIEATDGEDALDIIGTGVRLDLVFSDVRMPGPVDGLQLLDIIRRSDPGLPVLVTSGHCDPALALGGGAVGFVRKPYDLDVLIGLVQDELGQARTAPPR